MQISSWGRYPVVEGREIAWSGQEDLTGLLQGQGEFLPRGNARSYGDCALAPTMVNGTAGRRFLFWDEQTGDLECEAGVLLADILETFVPRGWFLPTTPGTKWITIGGAIASDVHGKNHHGFGCFSAAVQYFMLWVPERGVMRVSPTENPEWFQATCGGQGLTGFILSARIRLIRVPSAQIEQITTKTRTLEETFAAFAKHKEAPYSVAWIDCLAKGDQVGRCLLTTGHHAPQGDLKFSNKMLATIPDVFPALTLNGLSMKAFNVLYYGKAKMGESTQKVPINSFFYPLDIMSEWNRIYGKPGFMQYQFVLPLDASLEGLRKILQAIGASGKGSFLAVLKLLGKSNDNWLSFPTEGYTLALDFKNEPAIFPLLERLDAMVLDYGGRFYLTKDSRMSKTTFERGYPQVERFRAWREQQGLRNKIWSLQSRRLGL